MSNFDWSKVTTAHLYNVPRTVIGSDFDVDTDDRPILLEYKGLVVAELWSGESGWHFSNSAGFGYVVLERTVRETIACIDRIENYLRMQGAT